MDIDLEELAALVALLKEAEFSEFRYEKGDLQIVVRRGALAAESAGAPSPPKSAPLAPVPVRKAAAAQASARDLEIPEGSEPVLAPLLGTFYSRPKPGEPPFVAIGDRVEPDTVLCIVEVMKLMNSVEAGRSGVIVAIHAQDGELVEFGHPLFSIAPAENDAT